MSLRPVAPFSVLLGRAPDHPRPGPAAARARYHRTLFGILGFWTVLTWVAVWVLPVAGLGVAAVGVVHLVVAYALEQRRRTRTAGDSETLSR